MTVPGMSNTSDFILKKEDHTMGNLLAEHLKQAPHVLMCGYKGTSALVPIEYARSQLTVSIVAHPNVPEVMIRVQTDGTITPKDALVDVCKQLIGAYAQLAREFTREYELRKMVSAGNQDQPNGF
jgi:DNA-directed RNA polymerase II subunit RPB11